MTTTPLTMADIVYLTPDNYRSTKPPHNHACTRANKGGNQQVGTITPRSLTERRVTVKKLCLGQEPKFGLLDPK
jgi:hypothetical protein